MASSLACEGSGVKRMDRCSSYWAAHAGSFGAEAPQDDVRRLHTRCSSALLDYRADHEEVEGKAGSEHYAGQLDVQRDRETQYGHPM